MALPDDPSEHEPDPVEPSAPTGDGSPSPEGGGSAARDGSPSEGSGAGSDPTAATGDREAVERRRVEAVRETGLVGVEAGERLDRIARRAAKVAGTPLGLISLVDAEEWWAPGVHGEVGRRLERKDTFCSAAIETPEPLVVSDASVDPRFSALPVVAEDPGFRFYAGQPIDDGEGNLIGVVCVLDTTPRDASPELLQALSDLATWARLELLRERAASGGAPPDAATVASAAASDERLRELERLQALVVSTTAHELRTPLTVLRAHAEMLMAAGDELGPAERASLAAISKAVVRLEEVSDGLVADLRDTAGGAEDALKRWLKLEDGSQRIRPRPSED